MDYDATPAQERLIAWAETPPTQDRDPDADFPDMMNTEQAAQYLGVAPCTVRRRVNEGKIPLARRGSRGQWHRFYKKDLQAIKGGI